jgi:hypothetical protein
MKNRVIAVIARDLVIGNKDNAAADVRRIADQTRWAANQGLMVERGRKGANN